MTRPRETSPALWLHGMGHFHPPTEITNAFLEELDIGTSDAWIQERVGIRSRRTVLPLDYLRTTRNRDMRAAAGAATLDHAALAASAAELALARAGIGAADVGLVISGSSGAWTLTPAEACTVAARLGIEAPAFDVNSACTSFWAGLTVLAGMGQALPDFVLLVTVDTLTRSADYSDRASAVLWGDAASAAVLSSRVPASARVLGCELRSSPAAHGRVGIPRTGYFTQEGRAVQMFAIKKSVEGIARLAESFDSERPQHFVGHQANLRALDAICERAGVEPGHHHSNVEWFGNTGAPGGPSVVSQNWEKWRGGDDVALVGVGGGLSWAHALLRFENAALGGSQEATRGVAMSESGGSQ